MAGRVQSTNCYFFGTLEGHSTKNKVPDESGPCICPSVHHLNQQLHYVLRCTQRQVHLFYVPISEILSGDLFIVRISWEVIESSPLSLCLCADCCGVFQSLPVMSQWRTSSLFACTGKTTFVWHSLHQMESNGTSRSIYVVPIVCDSFRPAFCNSRDRKCLEFGERNLASCGIVLLN